HAPGSPQFARWSRPEDREQRASSKYLSPFCYRREYHNRSQKQPIFRTLNSASKMAHFIGLSATLFRGVFRTVSTRDRMSAFGVRVQLVTATLLVVYRQGFRIPRSSAGVD